MATKLRIKLGEAEVDFEGEESFIKEELPNLLLAVSKLHRELGIGAEQKFSPSKDGGSKLPQNTKNISTSTIAQKIGGGTGPDLALAAAGYITLVGMKESFSRKELLTEMKNAKTLYKATYSKNLSGALKTLCGSGKLNELGADNYSLNASIHEEIGKKISE